MRDIALGRMRDIAPSGLSLLLVTSYLNKGFKPLVGELASESPQHVKQGREE
jgi:hypothetical protein